MEWVIRERVAEIIEDWCARYEKENECKGAGEKGRTALALQTGIDVRQIHFIIKGMQPGKGGNIPYNFVSTSLVDRLLCGIDRTDMWHVELEGAVVTGRVETKVCVDCDKRMPLKEFYKINQSRPSRRAACRKCWNARNYKMRTKT